MADKSAEILIIDDDPSVRSVLEQFFKIKGYSVIFSAATAKEALDIIEKEEIKLALLDIKLPDMPGLEVLRKIKQVKKDIGVIMITGFPDEGVAKQAMAEGAYDYIIKPFDLQYLELSVFSKIALML